MEKKKRPYTEAQKASAKKWDSQNLERLNVAFRRGEVDTIRAAAARAGSSVNGWARQTLLQAAEAQAQAPEEID